MVLFDEKAAFDGFLEEGLFDMVSNSYVVVIGEAFDTQYVKYSNDRDPKYMIRTEFCKNDDGVICVRKYPLSKEAGEHVRGMEAAYQGLKERYAGGKLEINRCKLVEEDEEVYGEFEFVQGVPLSELLDACLERDDADGFHKLFKEYVERISYNSSYPVADFDLIFANILVDGDTWTLIDYEWTFGKAMDVKELAFRAVYCYLLEDEKRNKLSLDRILEELGITEADAESYREQEMAFQQFVTGKRMSMATMRDNIGYRLLEPQKWIDKYQDSESVNRVQIYEDEGNGYSEENSYFVQDAYQGENFVELELEVSGNVRMLRIDPAMASCIVKVREMTFNGVVVPLDTRKVLYTNGCVQKGQQEHCPSIVFATEDPNINLNLMRLERKAQNNLHVQLEVVRLPMSIAEDMAGKSRKFF